MRVVTTCHKAGLEEYGRRWLAGRMHWPKDTTFWWYREGYGLPDGLNSVMVQRDILDIEAFVEWKAKHIGYRAPDYRFDVVKFAHKVFAAADALYDYTGIGVWLDADCVTYKTIPDGLIEKQVEDAYIACYQRTGLYTETGLWIMDCSHPEHKAFLDYWRDLYHSEGYRQLPHWHDCLTLDATIRHFGDRIKVNNLSGEWSKHMHPQAMSELGQYIDHCKGGRKEEGRSPENKQREAA